MIRTINCLLALFLVLLVSCSKTTDASRREEATVWFEANKNQVLSIFETLIDNPKLSRIEKRRMALVPNSESFTSEERAIYDDVLQKLPELGVESIIVSRERNAIEGRLISVSFVLVAEGLSLGGGYVLEVVYIPGTKLIDNAAENGFSYFPLKEEKWYVSEYRDNY